MSSSDDESIISAVPSDFKKKGIINVTVITAKNLPGLPSLSSACKVELGGSEGITQIVSNGGPNPKFRASFEFEYDMENFVIFTVVDGDTNEEIATCVHSLKDVLSSPTREWNGDIKLDDDKGFIEANLFFLEEPLDRPQFLSLKISSARKLVNMAKDQRFFIRSKLGDDGEQRDSQIGVNEGSLCPFNFKTKLNYSNERHITLQLVEEKSSSVAGSCLFNLWNARRGGRVSAAGEIPLMSGGKQTGALGVSVAFWSPGEEIPEFPSSMVALPEVAPQDEEDKNRQNQRAEEIRKNAEKKAKNAAEAAEVAEHAARKDPFKATVKAARQAREKADEAEKLAKKAQKGDLSEVEKLAKEAEVAADESVQAAKEATACFSDNILQKRKTNTRKTKNALGFAHTAADSANTPKVDKELDRARAAYGEAEKQLDSALNAEQDLADAMSATPINKSGAIDAIDRLIEAGDEIGKAKEEGEDAARKALSLAADEHQKAAKESGEDVKKAVRKMNDLRQGNLRSPEMENQIRAVDDAAKSVEKAVEAAVRQAAFAREAAEGKNVVDAHRAERKGHEAAKAAARAAYDALTAAHTARGGGRRAGPAPPFDSSPSKPTIQILKRTNASSSDPFQETHLENPEDMCCFPLTLGKGRHDLVPDPSFDHVVYLEESEKLGCCNWCCGCGCPACC